MFRDVHNPFIDMYISAWEALQNNGNTNETLQIILNPQMRLIMETGADRRRENLPTSKEVGLIIQDDEYSGPGHRDIVVTECHPDGRGPKFHRISHNNAAYIPLHYVLLFPTG
ncbi:hypothetical protein LPUS_03610 [Lasallia pustulata]|uniref:Uncharacterized protein n=1 Tax=Lasallia pustulata TaxID=136370 RepID=A0A1W5CV47_9LECA|nr:hypothetical protein LPUS_03610 [Lasallia pustulata]